MRNKYRSLIPDFEELDFMSFERAFKTTDHFGGEAKKRFKEGAIRFYKKTSRIEESTGQICLKF